MTRVDPMLSVFLGELRAGSDVRAATIIAEMTAEEGERHALAEQRGEYADVVTTPPIWSMANGVLTIRGTDGEIYDLPLERPH